FFNNLYNNVPRRERLGVMDMEYHSPGHIRFSALESVVQSVHRCVDRITADYEHVRTIYRALHEGMSTRKLLGRSRSEIEVDAGDEAWVETWSRQLASAIDFPYMDEIVDLTEQDWITAAKILMSFHRRLETLTDIY